MESENINQKEPDQNQNQNQKDSLFLLSLDVIKGSTASQFQTVVSWLLSIILTVSNVYFMDLTTETKILFVICYMLLIMATINISRTIRHNEDVNRCIKFLGKTTMHYDGSMYVFYSWVCFLLSLSVLTIAVMTISIPFVTRVYLGSSSVLIASTTSEFIKLVRNKNDADKYLKIYKTE
ncbi:MAG: hypothetical protein Terrestrivirus1_121 [Terrestrivirus sp.]|uniref:Transmembrane protein n=1 Tax=Terrestrivirus sp. TaxID=2487775 RepID=A0A3G4ZK92_9VIRU|nr:MAG: hypothetical protein Terrestrivirus1_121 [Terrestrivirus sp.]